jgi:DNA-binding IclR family transcriptional regulator
MLAFLSRDQREEILSSLTFERFTSHTIPDANRLRRELAKIFRQGYALDDREADLGARCVAAPILDDTGKLLAALSVSGPITRITRAKIPSFATMVKNAARDVSSRLNRSG